jgi:hypothetical protein
VSGARRARGEQQQRNSGDDAGEGDEHGVPDALGAEDEAGGGGDHDELDQGDRGEPQRFEGEAADGIDPRTDLLLHETVGAEARRQGQAIQGNDP